ncbi:MAG: hypothetical protein WDW38_011105 [Sanguina aurantia]
MSMLTLPSLPAKARICVVGSGVVGLTSALRILQARKSGGVQGSLTVVADRFGKDTTTHGAAGVWGPYKLSSTPDALVHAWGADTHAHLMALIYSRDAAHAGCSLARVNILTEAPEASPFWSDIPFDFQRMRQEQLTYFPERFVDGYSYTTVTCEGAFYMAWLSQQIRDLGGVFVQRKLSLLDEIPELGEFDAIVDCCGLGSHDLCGDKESYPIRGQLIRVRAPWVTQGLFGGSSYIIPNRNCVILGGTGQIGNWSTEVSLEDKAAIWEGCCELLPSLRDAEHLGDWVAQHPTPLFIVKCHFSRYAEIWSSPKI